jgi:integrase
MRYPKPFYRTGRDAWVVQLGRRQLTLARGRENEPEAWKAYHRLMAAEGQAAPSEDMTVALACDLFLDRAEQETSAGNYQQYRIKLQDFCDHHGHRRVTDLRIKHLDAWIKAHSWSASTVRGGITAVKACLNWCVRMGHVGSNPLKDAPRPKMGRRTRTVAPQEREIVRGRFDEAFRDFLDALTWTGARPGEVMHLEASHIDWVARHASLPGKTTDRTGLPVGFPLVPPMLELCRRLAEVNPTGPLFRNRDGNPWTPNAVRCRMRRMRSRLGIAGITAYTYRHSYVTDALQRGIPLADVAALVNHRDIRTTMNYNHIDERMDHLRSQAERAIKPDES